MTPIHPELNWQELTPQEGNYLFGYYDRIALSPDNARHLALRVPQQERLPQPGECAEVGYIEIASRKFVSLAQTESWCHQQGAMTIWLRNRPGHFIFNDYRQTGGNWQPVARICHADSGSMVGEYPCAIYQVSPDGRWGGVLDFARIPRRGYSYSRAILPVGRKTPDLDNDGLFVIDMQSAQLRMVASYRQMLEVLPCPYDLEGQYIWLNHIIFNADSSRISVLLRYRDEATGNSMWKTNMLTMNLDGSDMLCPLPEMLWRNGGISHQLWGRTPREILIDANWCGKGSEYVVFDESIRSMRAQRISAGMGPMAHLIFSPDGEWLAADTYPVDGWQRLALVRVKTGEVIELGRFAHPAVPTVDVRCDLHPRWSGDGRFLTVDTIHFGPRRICMLDVRPICQVQSTANRCTL